MAAGKLQWADEKRKKKGLITLRKARGGNLKKKRGGQGGEAEMRGVEALSTKWSPSANGSWGGG